MKKKIESEKVRALALQGKSQAAAARELGVSQGGLNKFVLKNLDLHAIFAQNLRAAAAARLIVEEQPAPEIDAALREPTLRLVPNETEEEKILRVISSGCAAAWKISCATGLGALTVKMTLEDLLDAREIEKVRYSDCEWFFVAGAKPAGAFHFADGCVLPGFAPDEPQQPLHSSASSFAA